MCGDRSVARSILADLSKRELIIWPTGPRPPSVGTGELLHPLVGAAPHASSAVVAVDSVAKDFVFLLQEALTRGFVVRTEQARTMLPRGDDEVVAEKPQGRSVVEKYRNGHAKGGLMGGRRYSNS